MKEVKALNVLTAYSIIIQTHIALAVTNTQIVTFTQHNCLKSFMHTNTKLL